MKDSFSIKSNSINNEDFSFLSEFSKIHNKNKGKQGKKSKKVEIASKLNNSHESLSNKETDYKTKLVKEDEKTKSANTFNSYSLINLAYNNQKVNSDKEKLFFCNNNMKVRNNHYVNSVSYIVNGNGNGNGNNINTYRNIGGNIGNLSNINQIQFNNFNFHNKSSVNYSSNQQKHSFIQSINFIFSDKNQLLNFIYTNPNGVIDYLITIKSSSSLLRTYINTSINYMKDILNLPNTHGFIYMERILHLSDSSLRLIFLKSLYKNSLFLSKSTLRMVVYIINNCNDINEQSEVVLMIKSDFLQIGSTQIGSEIINKIIFSFDSHANYHIYSKIYENFDVLSNGKVSINIVNSFILSYKNESSSCKISFLQSVKGKIVDLINKNPGFKVVLSLLREWSLVENEILFKILKENFVMLASGTNSSRVILFSVKINVSIVINISLFIYTYAFIIYINYKLPRQFS